MRSNCLVSSLASSPDCLAVWPVQLPGFSLLFKTSSGGNRP